MRPRWLSLVILLCWSLVVSSAWAQGQLINGSRVLAGSLNYCTDTNADANANTLVCALNPAISTYRTGMRYTIKAGSTNTGAVTLNLNGLGAKTIKKVTGGITTDLAANDIHTGQIIDLIYDGTNMQMLSQLGNAPSGTAGVIEAASYGVVCTDGSVDTTAALQAAVTAAKSGVQGKRLAMPAGGICKLSATILASDVIGFVLDGNGVKFTWSGNTSTPMFLCRDCRESRLHGFQVEVSTAALVRAVFQFENGSGSLVTPTNNTVENVFVECVNGGCTDAIRMAVGAGGNNNNDFNAFKHVSVNNVANSCGKIEHSQSKHNVFEDFACGNNGIGAHIIEVVAGSFHCVRCQGGYSTGADFYMADTSDGVLVLEGNFEGSARLLETGGPSGAPYPVTIQSTRWANNNLHADKKAIAFKFPGPLILLNNLFEGATENEPMEISFTPGGGIGALVSLGNYVASTLANPYTGVQPTLSSGNVIDRNDGASVVPLDTLLRVGDVTFAVLGAAPYTTAVNGSLLYCSNCARTNPCTGSGSGGLAVRVNGQWSCL